MGPLSGTTILDLTSVLMGPYATQILADMGANVIKVESPEGDIVRQIGPGRTPGMGGMFLNVNRGKRSIVIDLKHPEGRNALLHLAREANAVVYNVRPQAMARLGLGYEELAAINPAIVYVGVFGYGQSGPYASKPAYEDLIQGAVRSSHTDCGGRRRHTALRAHHHGRSHRRSHGCKRHSWRADAPATHRSRAAHRPSCSRAPSASAIAVSEGFSDTTRSGGPAARAGAATAAEMQSASQAHRMGPDL